MKPLRRVHSNLSDKYPYYCTHFLLNTHFPQCWYQGGSVQFIRFDEKSLITILFSNSNLDVNFLPLQHIVDWNHILVLKCRFPAVTTLSRTSFELARGVLLQHHIGFKWSQKSTDLVRYWQILAVTSAVRSDAYRPHRGIPPQIFFLIYGQNTEISSINKTAKI